MMTRNGGCTGFGWRALFLGVLMAAGGCAVVDQRSRAELEAAYGPNPPRIEAGYAAPMVSPRDDWRAYIKGSDPDGDVRYIQVWIWIPGGSMTPVRLEVDPDQARSISGYLVLNTNDLPESLVRLRVGELRLMVALEDRAGHRSDVRTFPVSIILGAKQAPPPSGAFAERFLGNVPLAFLQVDSFGGSGAAFP